MTSYDDEEVKFVFDRDFGEGDTAVHRDQTKAMPRMAARDLAKRGLGHVDEDVPTQVKAALAATRYDGEFSVSDLDPHFYKRAIECIRGMRPGKERDGLASLLNTLVRVRRGRIMACADSAEMNGEWRRALADEEKGLYEGVRAAAEAFEGAVSP